MRARYRGIPANPIFEPLCRCSKQVVYIQVTLDDRPCMGLRWVIGADSQLMATKKQCEAALLGLAKRLDGVDGSLKKRHAPDRTVICRIPDLNTTFSGRLTSGALCDISDTPMNDAQIKLTVSSDDLLAVTAGELSFASAWAEGRLRIEASVLDMIRLRSLL